MTKLGILMVFASVTALLVSIPAEANEPEVTVKLKDVKYGLYSTRSRATGGSRITKHYRGKHIRTVTQIVPMRTGAAFGLEMRVEASEGKELQVVIMVEHPSIRRGTPFNAPYVVRRSSNRIRWQFKEMTAWTIRLRNNSLLSTGYILDNDWEMVPGTWTISVHLIGIDETIRHNASDLLEHSTGMELYKKSFCIVPQDEAPPCDGLS